MTSGISAIDVTAAIREVTDKEIAFYAAHGWVKLDRLITPELAAELLRIGLSIDPQGGLELTRDGPGCGTVPLAGLRREHGA